MPRKFAGPLQPGKRSAMVPKRTPRRKTVPAKKLTTMVKRIQLKQCETQRKGLYFGALADPPLKQLGHNITEYIPTIYATDQGITNASGAMPSPENPAPFYPGARIGNEIILKALSIKIQLDNAIGSAIHYKLIVFEYDTHIAESDVKDALLWQGLNGQGVNNVLRSVDSIATNRVKVLRQFTITQTENTNTSVRNYYIPLKNRKIRYVDNNSKKPQFRDCAVALVAVGRQTEQVGHHIANASIAIKLTYKDP